MRRSTKPQNAAAVAPPAKDPHVAQLLRGLRGDPELGAVVREYEGRAETASAGRKFGSNGLKAGGKLFALFTQGTLVVKLPRERVAQLVAAKVGKPFDPGHGRLMKEWLTVTGAKALWIELAREAFVYVNGSRR
jgi:hypothetical protein